MLRLIILLIILFASVWLGVQIVHHPGYLFLVVQPWMIQMPLWFAALSLALLLVVFYFLIGGIDWLQMLWYRFKNWRKFRREQRSYSKTQQGLLCLIEGRWQKAEKLLLAGVSQTVEPLVNYLGAAKAAHEQGANARRDEDIKKAYEIAPSAEIAIGLTQAKLDMEQNQFEHARGILTHLQQLSPRHPQVLSMLEKLYVRTADWQHLQALLPSLRKAKILNAEQLEQFEKNLYCELLNHLQTQNIEKLHQLWAQIPRALRKSPEVVIAYVHQLQRFAVSKEIEELVRKTLKYTWQPELVNVYSGLAFDDLNHQLVIGAGWLKQYGPHPEILLFLAKLCVRVQLWGKAKDYFSKCLGQGPNPQASLAYGKLLEQLGETDQALQVYRDGLKSRGDYGINA